MTEHDRFQRNVDGLAALQRMRRPAEAAPPAPTVTPTSVEQEPPAPPPATPGGEKAPRRAPAAKKLKNAAQSAAQRPSGATGAKEQLGARVPADIAARARAAYRATSYLEGEQSFGDFVATALRREVERREQESNNGKPFPDMGHPLPVGRRPKF